MSVVMRGNELNGIFLIMSAPHLIGSKRSKLSLSWIFIFRCGTCYQGACLSFPSWLFFQMLYFVLFGAVAWDQWSVSDAQWAKLMGYLRVQSWRCPLVIYFFLVM